MAIVAQAAAVFRELHDHQIATMLHAILMVVHLQDEKALEEMKEAVVATSKRVIEIADMTRDGI